MSIVIAFLLVLSCGSAADGASPLALPTVDVIQTAAVEMDVYSTRSDGKVPIVVLLHGGTTEGRIQLEPLARTLSQRDLLVFVPQWDAIPDLEVFREDPGAALLGQTVDVVCAVRQARVSAPALGGDPDQLVLVADSQAGAVALRTALSPGAAWPEADCNPTIDHVPDSFVGLAGNYSGSQYRNLITPIELWDRFDPAPVCRLRQRPAHNPRPQSRRFKRHSTTVREARTVSLASVVMTARCSRRTTGMQA